METSAILQIVLSVIIEKGLSALGRRLAKSTKKLWQRLHATNPEIPSDPAAATIGQSESISRALEELAASDPEFKKDLDKWKKSIVKKMPNFVANIKTTNRFTGISINSSITQSNQIGLR